MSSTLLYLAIVAVWAVVLVPMWLRRDPDFSRLRVRRTGTLEAAYAGAVPEPADGAPTAPEPETVPENEVAELHSEPYEEQPAPRRRVGRATVIARRRRRTFGLLLLLIGSIVAVAVRVIPWWAIIPSVLLFAAHLALLRVAAGMDAARRRAVTAARAQARARARAEAERAREAEVIDFVLRTREVFDQYADDRRAVGD